jgi:allantoinase
VSGARAGGGGGPLGIRGALVIRGARTAAGQQVEIVVADGRIADVGASVTTPAGAQELDADGLLVLPGGVDPHVHFNAPGVRFHWEGWQSGSAAAAAGGITTVVEMPLNASPPTVDMAGFQAKAAVSDSHVDFGLWGGVIPGNRAQLDALARAGVMGFKAFMSESGADDFPASDELTLYEAMGTIAELGLPLLLHAESDRITAELTARAVAGGRTSVRDYLESRPPVAESEAIASAIELAAVTGCPLHIVHVSTARGVQLVAAARARGQDVSCELTAHHLLLTEDDAVELGAVAKCAPPLRDAAEVAALWQLLSQDETLFVVSDHSPAPPELKLGDDFFAIWGGIAGLQSTVELMVSESLGGGRLHAAQLPRLLATGAAERFRLPGKGALAPGMDADLTLIETGAERVLDCDELLDRHRFSPYVGRTLSARVCATYLRGELIYQDGRLVGPPRGRLLRPTALRLGSQWAR